MLFTYSVTANISVGQELYGIIAMSNRTYAGVYKITVSEIDFNNRVVIFDIDQPCGQVYCDFEDMYSYVFENAQGALGQDVFPYGLVSY